MEWLVFSIVMLSSFYSANRSAFAPDDLFFLGLSGEPIVCEEISELEARKKHHTRSGKLAGYSTSSESLCTKDIFDYGERDGRVDLIAKAARARSTHISLALSKISDNPARKKIPIFIDTTSIKDPYLASYLNFVFSESLTNSHKAGGVIRSPSVKKLHYVLKIGLAPTAFPEDVISAKISQPTTKKKPSEWMAL